MKKLLAFGLLSLVGVTALPAPPASAARTVEGTILAPAVAPPSVGLVTRHVRCMQLITGGKVGFGPVQAPTNGIIGWVVKLDPATDGGQPFTLERDEGSLANLSIVFYDALGSCDGVTGPGPTTSTPAHTNVPGDEAGVIPSTASWAIIVHELGVDEHFVMNIGVA